MIKSNEMLFFGIQKKYYIVLLLIFFIIIICYIFNIQIIYENNYECFTKENYYIPKQIYCYWNNLNGNDIINAHLESWKKNISGWKINILTEDNIQNYVSKDFYNKFKNLDSVRFSDFLRLELLKKGGVWMDAGIFVKNSKFLDDYRNEMILYHSDVCLYEFKKNTIDKNIPYLENWFIMAPNDSKFINDLYYEFERAFDMGFLKYKLDVIIPSGIPIDKTVGYSYDYTYLLQHAIINYIYTKNKYNILIKDAEESMFKIQFKLKNDGEDLIKFIINNKNWDDFYAVKMTHDMRKYIDNYRQKYIETILNL